MILNKIEGIVGVPAVLWCIVWSGHWQIGANQHQLTPDHSTQRFSPLFKHVGVFIWQQNTCQRYGNIQHPLPLQYVGPRLNHNLHQFLMALNCAGDEHNCKILPL